MACAVSDWFCGQSGHCHSLGQISTRFSLPFLAMRVFQFVPWWFLEGWFGVAGQVAPEFACLHHEGGRPPGLGRLLAIAGLLRVPVSARGLLAIPLASNPRRGALAWQSCCPEVLGATVLMIPMRARSGYRDSTNGWCDTRLSGCPPRKVTDFLNSRRRIPPWKPDLAIPGCRSGWVRLLCKAKLGEQGGAVFLCGEDPACGDQFGCGWW